MNFYDILSLLINNPCGIKARRKSWISRYKYIIKQLIENTNEPIIARYFSDINWKEYVPDSKDMLATDWEIVQ